MSKPRLIIVTDRCVITEDAAAPADIASGLLAAATVGRLPVEFCGMRELGRLEPGPGTLVTVSGAYTQFIDSAYKAARFARRRGAVAVMGGAHVSALPEEALRYCDGVVRYEAETVWPRVLEDFLKSRLSPVYEGEPATDILPQYYLDYLIGGKYRTSFVEAVRGCSRSCEFCSVNPYFGKTRFADLSRMDRLLASIGERNFVRFTAPDIFVDEDYFRELCAICRRHGVRWKAYSSIGIAACDWALETAKRSGCAKLEIGFEDLDPAHTPKLAFSGTKAGSPAAFETAADRIRSFGITLIAYLVAGGDNLAARDYARHFRFVFSRSCSVSSTFMLTPFPGSRLYERLLREGRLSRRPWSDYNRFRVVFKSRLPGIFLYAVFVILNIFGETLPPRKIRG